MSKPFKHPRNDQHWYGRTGRGRNRRAVNLGVALTEPITIAQAVLDKLNAEQPATSLADFHREFVAELRRRNPNARRKPDARRVQQVIAGCHFHTVADVSVKVIEDWLNRRQKPHGGGKIADETFNKYVKQCRQFFTWLAEAHGIANPALMLKIRRNKKRIKRRRTLGDDEIGQLLRATATAPGFRDLTGRARSLLYWAAIGSGFRAGELAALTPSCLIGTTLHLSGSHTKNGEDAVQPLPADLAEALARHVEGKPADAPIWPGTWSQPGTAAKMLKRDLELAGIPYRTAAGDVDFHALRHVFSCRVARGITDVKLISKLTRHKDSATLLGYLHVNEQAKAAAVEKLALAPFAQVTMPDCLTDADAVAHVAPTATLDDQLQRLFGTTDLSDLELLGKVSIDEEGNVRLGFGPFAGKVLGVVDIVGVGCSELPQVTTFGRETDSSPNRFQNHESEYPRQGSNLQPSASEADALSN